MPRVLVFADDLTGAAEIAGIARRFGCGVDLLRVVPQSLAADVTVVDTDSRGLSPEDAARHMARLTGATPLAPDVLLFKKTDSALRGPIAAEIVALLRGTGRNRAALLAQNPARGRTVRDGIYSIDGIPLEQTAFARDPTHPATSSHVLDLLGPSTRARSLPVGTRMSPGDDDDPPLILVLDAVNDDDVRRWVAGLPDRVLPAGGADFFTAWLAAQLPGSVPATSPPPETTPVDRRDARRGSDDPSPEGTSLLIRGTATPLTDGMRGTMTRRGYAWIALPGAVFANDHARASSLPGWSSRLVETLARSRKVAVHVDHPLVPSADVAARIERALAEVTARILEVHQVDELLVEGGSTASAICRRLGWERFELRDEVAPGIVRLRPIPRGRTGPRTAALIVKPGSYPWPAAR